MLAIAAAGLLTWWTVIAFVGGRLWPLPVEVEGGFGFGLFWLLVIDPLAATVLGWAFMLTVAPIVGVVAHVRRR